MSEHLVSADSVILKPIGVFNGSARYKYEQPRQGSCESSGVGEVILEGGLNLEQALEDLAGFDRIWLIYRFHLNSDSWRTKAIPPVAPSGKSRIGLFASRSPYRPNPIGLSCVRLVSVHKRIITVAEADLLDGTPILDIKPYIPAFDSFPDASAGWLEDQVKEEYAVSMTAGFVEKSGWLLENSGLDAESFARVQLSINPADSARKRVRVNSNGEGLLSYRTWRLEFSIDRTSKEIIMKDLFSGYATEELPTESADPHEDKMVHRAFIRRFYG